MRAGFGVALAVVVAAAVGLRVAHLLLIAPPTTGIEDGFYFHAVAEAIATGRGFVDLKLAPTAQHPPLYPLVLASVWKLGVTGDEAQRSLGVVFGGLSVVGVGLLGRRVAGELAGLLAAAIVAVNPLLIAADGALLSETLLGPVVAFTLLAAWRLGEQPSVRRAALTGAGIGAATMIRSESILLLPLLGLPLAWRGGGPRLARLAAVSLCAAVVIAPWVARNWSVFGRPLLSNNEGLVVASANCHSAYYGAEIGAADPACARPVTGNEAQRSSKLQADGIRYARSHAARVPLVAAARLAGTWQLYAPFRSAREQGRSVNVEKVGIVFAYPLLLLALLGAIVLRRRRTQLIVLIAPVIVVSVTAVLTYGAIRVRYAAEIPLAVLAAAGLLSLRRPRAMLERVVRGAGLTALPTPSDI